MSPMFTPCEIQAAFDCARRDAGGAPDEGQLLDAVLRLRPVGPVDGRGARMPSRMGAGACVRCRVEIRGGAVTMNRRRTTPVRHHPGGGRAVDVFSWWGVTGCWRYARSNSLTEHSSMSAEAPCTICGKGGAAIFTVHSQRRAAQRNKQRQQDADQTRHTVRSWDAES